MNLICTNCGKKVPIKDLHPDIVRYYCLTKDSYECDECLTHKYDTFINKLTEEKYYEEIYRY